MNSIIKLVVVLSSVVIISAGIMFALIVTVNPFGYFESEEDAETVDASSAPKDSDLNKLVNGEMNFEVSDESKNGNPSELKFSDRLHEMTHQKVYAETKWGHHEITDERINEMLRTAKQSDYKYKELYIDSLEQWKTGNFKNAVQVHNVIWKSKNGSIGKAQRLLTDREEMEYRAKHFD